jgi:hypothetical protein
MRTVGRVPWRLGILAAFAALATSCEQIRVTVVEVASLTVDPSEGTVAPGDTLRLRATLRDASGNDLENRPIEWRSDDPEVVRLEGEGLVRGMSPGTTTVRASSEGATGEASITVLTGPDMVLSPSSLTFEAVAGGNVTNSRSVSISKEGPGILEGIEVSVIHPSGEPTGWLEATLAGTTAPTVASVRADPSDLPAGTYEGRVRMSASTAANSPRFVEVTFVVEARDDADRAPCTEMEALLADLKAIEDANPESDLADQLEDVRQKVEEAYFERCVKHPPDRKAAAGNIEDAVDDMSDAIKDGLIGTSQGVGFLDRLLWVSRTMAIEAIGAAEARGGRQRNIEKAEERVAEGDALHAEGEFEDAAKKYTDAVSEAEKA